MPDSGLIASIRRLTYPGPGRVAFLVGKPAPGVHELLDRVTVRTGIGFEGDHERKAWWRGRVVPGREVTAVALEVLGAMRLAPDVPGDNLVTAGIDLSGIRAGDELWIGPVVLRRSPKSHRPCTVFRDRAGQAAFEAAAAGFRGALFSVVEGGTMAVGDAVTVHRRGEA